MIFTEEELRERIKQEKKDVEWSLNRLNKKDPDDTTRAPHRHSLYLDCYSVGVHMLLLNEADEARQWFTKATHHEIESIRLMNTYREELGRANWYEVPNQLWFAMLTAILTDDEKLLEDSVEEALAFDDSYLDEFARDVSDYWRAKALAAVIERTNDRQTVLETFKDGVDNEFDTAIVTILAGLNEIDEATVTDGLGQLLAFHEDVVGDEVTSYKELISLPATGLVLLAHRRGLDVSIESEYVPKSLLPDS